MHSICLHLKYLNVCLPTNILTFISLKKEEEILQKKFYNYTQQMIYECFDDQTNTN